MSNTAKLKTGVVPAASLKVERTARVLLVLSLALGAGALLLLRGQEGTTVSTARASLALGGLYASWLIVVGSVSLAIIGCVRSRRVSWWTVLGVLVLVGLSWVVGCAVPKAVLS